MNWVSSELAKGVKFSDAVAAAVQQRFTEQDPLEDLSGIEMCRKAIVLGNQFGVHLTLQDIDLEPIVPLDMLQKYMDHKREEPETPVKPTASQGFPTPAKLIAALKKEDPKVAKFIAAGDGRLRYVMQFTLGEASGVKCSIKPEVVGEDHPLYRMTGTEIYTAFTLERQPYPIIMRGAQGAGSESSSGILNDILKIAQRIGR